MSEKEFIKDVDYHLKDGRVVLTKKYLEECGECCGGTCELCPYSERVKGNKELK
tara:strand:+ start:37863 stop:38024 length:162 start_codon:yes stop_codon:yes gene_type:complete